MSNKIKLLSTSDIHGKIFPHDYGDGHKMDYGLLKIAALVEEYRDENTLLIDNGDTLEGSPLQFFHMAKVKEGESPVTRVMNGMKYDYVNVGNHDFDYGIDALRNHIEGTGAKCINVNMGCPYDVVEISGKRIAIFGVLTHHTAKWQSKDKLTGVNLRDDFEIAKETAQRIKLEANPDYIICCYHGGLEIDPDTMERVPGVPGENQGFRFLDEIDEIDILIAGHQHRVSCGVYKNKAYTQPGMNGSFLSFIEIDIDTGVISPQLVALDQVEVEAKASLIPLVSEEEALCQEWLDETIGESKVDLRIQNEEEERLHKPQLITFLNLVQMERMGADLSAASLFEGARGFGERITMRDLIVSYSFPNTLVLKKISGKVLREYLEKDMEYWEYSDAEIKVNPAYLSPVPMHFNYDLLDGVEYNVNVANPPGQRITSLTRNGREIGEEDEFTIALNNYRASGGGDFPMLVELETVSIDLTNMVDVLAEYIMKHKVIEFSPVNNIVIEAEER